MIRMWFCVGMISKPYSGIVQFDEKYTHFCDGVLKINIRIEVLSLTWRSAYNRSTPLTGIIFSAKFFVNSCIFPASNIFFLQLCIVFHKSEAEHLSNFEIICGNKLIWWPWNWIPPPTPLVRTLRKVRADSTERRRRCYYYVLLWICHNNHSSKSKMLHIVTGLTG